MVVTAERLIGRKGGTLYTIDPDEPVLEAIRLMAAHSIGAVLVMKGNELAGIVSERDYARKIVLLGRSSSATPVWQIMSTPVVTAKPDDGVRQCMQVMTEMRIRHLPVVEGGRMVGMISIGDLGRVVIEDQDQTIEHLNRFIAG